jgi:uncharacterized phiE125 gp8 family phage protein
VSLELVTAPTEEPITLDEAKAHVFVLNGDYDEYIRSLITAAMVVCETKARQTLLATTWRQRLPCWPACGVIELLRPPLVSVTSVSYVDENGTTQTLAGANYTVDVNSKPGRILRGYGVTWPSLRAEGVAAPVTIEYVAGYANIAAVPAPFKHAMKLLIGHWFKQREEVNIGNIANTVPMAADALIASVSHGSYP